MLLKDEVEATCRPVTLYGIRVTGAVVFNNGKREENPEEVLEAPSDHLLTGSVYFVEEIKEKLR